MSRYTDSTISTGRVIRFSLSHTLDRPIVTGDDFPEGILDDALGKSLLRLAERSIDDTKNDNYGEDAAIRFKELISRDKELRELSWLYRINRIFYGDSIEGVEIAFEVIRYCRANNI